MAEQEPRSSEDMIREAREGLTRPSMVIRDMNAVKESVEVDDLESEIEALTAAPTATRPQPTATATGPSRRRAQPMADPFSRRGRVQRRPSGTNQAVAGAIALAVFILGIAVFLAFVSASP
jgi:hypothetical protein